ncbi:MAG TPA: DUF4358 domain-containing protein [Caproiciproducens sp.]|nr:DUF4358 domain-containing protein [Caproiciproducens sp.]
MKKILSLLLCAALILSFAACARAGAAKQADLGRVMSDMKSKLTNKEMMDLSSDDLMPNYGISTPDVKQFAAHVDSTGVKGDEIVLVEGKDSDAAKRIKEKLDARYKQKEIEMKDYLPAEYAVLKKCTVKQNGNYVSLIVSPQYEELNKIYDSAVQ